MLLKSIVVLVPFVHVLLEVQAAPKDPWQITKNRNVTVAIEEENIQLPKNTVPQTTIGIR